MSIWLAILLAAAGLFTVGLGAVHLVMPVLFDFEHAVPADGVALRELRLGPLRYRTTRRDVLGIAWVMNHAVSYALLSIGAVDLAALALPVFAGSGGILLAWWIAGWWLVRAVSQLYLGRRPLDWAFVALFLALAAVHVLVAMS